MLDPTPLPSCQARRCHLAGIIRPYAHGSTPRGSLAFSAIVSAVVGSVRKAKSGKDAVQGAGVQEIQVRSS
jgi:hypothetical protein